VVEHANKDGHRTISLPHGDAPYANHWMTNHNTIIDDPNFGEIPIQGLYNDPIEIDYDHFVVPNKLVKDRHSESESDQLAVLGSPRYNESWINTLSELAPDFEPDIQPQEWNVVLFTRQPSFNLNQDALAEVIRMLAKFDSLSTVVKHHTRTQNDALNRAFHDQTGKHIDDMGSIQLVSDDVHSTSLLQWGDLFIDVGVSVIFEAIMRDKPVLELEYTHWNESTPAHYLPDTAVKSRDDLYNYLRNANATTKGDGLQRTYTASEGNKFMSEMIYPKGKNVLEQYADLLVN
jgi:hypothetical protein